MALAVWLSACGSDSPGPVAPPPPVHSVEITAARVELLVGETHDYDAVPRSQSGQVLGNRTVSWTSEDETIASIDNFGVLLAKASGTVGIVATSEGKRARVEVRVRAPNLAPVLSAITPGIIPLDQNTDVALIATGTGFTAQSVLRIGGVARTTEFVSTTELRTMLTPDDARAVGTRPVTVFTPAPGGGESTPLPLVVQLPAPVIESLQPQRIVMGWGMSFTVTITGAGFTGATRLFLDDEPRDIEQRTYNTISFRLAPIDVRTARVINVRIENAAPGGGRALSTFEVQTVPVASVEITAPYGVLWTWAGLGLPVTGIVRSATNLELFDRIIQWSVQSQAVASIVPTSARQATVYGNNVGITTIRATADRISADATIKVYDTPAYDVLYSGGENGDRYIARWPVGTGTAPTRIPLGMQAMYPAPSPDGQYFAFSGLTGSHAELYIARADGSDIRRLTNDDASDLYAAWSPTGDRIAWVSTRRTYLNIFTMKPDGTDIQQLTFARLENPFPGSGEAATRPAWSPDGTRIAYTVQVGGRSQLWVMNANGSDPRRLAASAQGNDYEPTWSADGRTIAFRRTMPAPLNSYLARVDVASGSEIVSPLGVSIFENATPSWSPDGKWLMMSSSVVGDRPVLHAVPMPDWDRGPRPVLPAFWPGGVRDARWIRR